MFFIPGVLFFILGLIIGSFLNVVILRYNTGKSIRGRSACASCQKQLQAYELVPVVSYLMLRGRCSRCKSKISPQYALVELFAGVLFFLVFYKVIVSQGSGFSFSLGYHPLWYIWSIVYLLVQFSLLVIIFVYDFRHKIIPDGPMYTFIALALVQLVIAYRSVLFHTPALWALLAGPIFFAAFFLIWFLSRGRAMGFGDAKLVLGIGFFLGLAEGLSAIVLGFWIGALVSVLLIVLKSGDKRLTMKSEIPFAPFLIAGIILAYAFNLDLFSLHVFLHL